jgi:hypothetical protein
MKNYSFRVGQPDKFYLAFTVTAASAPEAVSIANQAFAEPLTSDEIFINTPLHGGRLDFAQGMRVDENMIIDEAQAHGLVPESTVQFLKAQGYNIGQPELDAGQFEKELEFVKTIETVDGKIYGLLQVNAYYFSTIDDCTYRIKAFLYPTAIGRTLDNEVGLIYKVGFWDAQAYITSNELPLLLEQYEDKFRKLIFALREEDPQDGLPM